MVLSMQTEVIISHVSYIWTLCWKWLCFVQVGGKGAIWRPFFYLSSLPILLRRRSWREFKFWLAVRKCPPTMCTKVGHCDRLGHTVGQIHERAIEAMGRCVVTSVWPLLEYGGKALDLDHRSIKLLLEHFKATYISIWRCLMISSVCVSFLTLIDHSQPVPAGASSTQ